MSFPLPLLIAAGIGLALVAGSKSKSSAGATGSTLQPGTGKYDSPGGAVMPLTLEQTVDRELADDNNPANLLQLASSLSPMYPKAVAALQARAAQLQAQPTGAPVAPAPAPVPVPAQPVGSPVIPPVASPPATPSPAPIVTIDPTTGGTVTTLPPTTITGDPNGQNAVQWWDASEAVSVNTAIPATYAQQSQETQAIQSALNAWALAAGYLGSGNLTMPLTVDGLFGPNTEQATADFQSWVNATQGGALAIDGLPGPETQQYLAAFGDMVSGPY